MRTIIKQIMSQNVIIPIRSYEHACKSNNWLKMHGMVKRRKPFKRMRVYEYHDDVTFDWDDFDLLERVSKERRNNLTY